MTKAENILRLFEKIGLSYDLDKEFDYLNNTLFNGEIVKPPVLEYVVNKKKLGLCTPFMLNGKIYTASIQISSTYNLTLQQLRSVLAHEMIHALQNQKQMSFKNGEEAHSGFFITMIDSINNLIKSKNLDNEIDSIKRTEDSTEINTFDNKPLKEFVGVAIINEPNKPKMCSVFKLDSMLIDIKNLNKLLLRNFKNATIEFYKSNNSTLIKFKVTSKTSKFDLVNISDKDYESITKDSVKLDPDSELDVSVMNKLKKPVGVILVDIGTKDKLIGVYELEGMKETIPTYVEKLTYTYRSNFKAYFLSCDIPIVNKYVLIKKDFKVIKMYGINQIDFDLILNNSTVIDKLLK